MHSIELGPLSLPIGLALVVLALITAILVGHIVSSAHRRPVESHIYGGFFVGLLGARAGFIAQQYEAYAQSPLSMVDIRDGGWSAWTGLACAWVYTLWIMLRQPLLKKQLVSSLVAASLVWVGGSLGLDRLKGEPRFLPSITTTTLNGQPINLASFTGQPTVINVWASWCPPCRREMPVFEHAQAQYPGIRFVMLNQGEHADQVNAFLREQQLRLEHVILDSNSQISRILNIKGLPTTLFFNASGQLVDTRVGELSNATLQAKLHTLQTHKVTP